MRYEDPTHDLGQNCGDFGSVDFSEQAFALSTRFPRHVFNRKMLKIISSPIFTGCLWVESRRCCLVSGKLVGWASSLGGHFRLTVQLSCWHGDVDCVKPTCAMGFVTQLTNSEMIKHRVTRYSTQQSKSVDTFHRYGKPMKGKSRVDKTLTWTFVRFYSNKN